MKRILKIVAKILLVITVCLAIFIGLLAYALNGLFSGMCGNEIFDEAMAPDNTLRAVVFQRDCGATTGFSTQISLIASNDTLKGDEGGNIFIVDGHPKERAIELMWRSPKQLVIGNTDGLEPKKKKYIFKNVDIVYE